MFLQGDSGVGVHPQLLKFPGQLGGLLHFDASEGHFYRMQKSIKCADSQFFLPLKSRQKTGECQAKRGEEKSHNHEKLSRDLVEYATIYWGCLLRVLTPSPTEETTFQSVEFIVSTWPHKLSIYSVPDLIQSIHEKIERNKTKKWMDTFLSDFDEKSYEGFFKFILKSHPYWSAPILVKAKGNLSHVLYKFEIECRLFRYLCI